MEAMEARDGEKEISEIGRGLGPVGIDERIPAPQGAFAM